MIGKTISHYRILAQIGEGGMGAVYVAEDTRLGRRVALKIPHAGHDERHYRSRFLREARAVSALSHPNIAAVYDYGETEDGSPFIVMELVTGQTLGDLLVGQGLTLLRAVEVIGQVAEALGEAHRRGIVHRDVKPSNVMLNDRGEVKVLDFGLAKQFGGGDADSPHPPSDATRSDVVIGTPLYLSPEQARGAAVDGRSDLFALGALLYECVAGRPAFSGGNVIEIGAQVIHFDPPPPSQFNPRVTPELDRVTMKALAKRPEERYQKAEELAADLARLRARLSGEDTARTRRLTTDAHLARPSALNTLAETLRRPRFSPLALVAALAAALLLVWGARELFAPRAHEPSPAARALFERGGEAMREGAYHKASRLFEDAVAADRRFALARARLAEALTEMDFLDRAKDELLAVSQLVPDRSALGQRERLYLEAVTATARRHYPEAVSAYEEIKRLDPDSPHVHVDLGRAYDKNNETGKALASYAEATARDPAYAAGFLRLGSLHARQKNVPAALAAFDRAAELYGAGRNPEGAAEVHYQRGRLFLDTQKIPEARRELEHAFELARATNSLYQQLQALFQLAHTEGDHARARATVSGAVELAQANGMQDQAALGHIRLGSIYLLDRAYAEAERHFQLGLDHARNQKVRRLEALALINFGSLRQLQKRTEEAHRFIAQARDFYQQGGYRKESQDAAALLGRSQRQKGDYAGALETFAGLLRSAEQSNDPLQTAHAHRECGAALYFQERSTEAVRHFNESIRIYGSLEQQTYIAYAQVYRASALLRAGRFDEARAAVAEAASFANRPASPNREMIATLRLYEAQMALARRQFPEARSLARHSLTEARALGDPARHLQSEAGLTLCLAEVRSGAAGRGRPLCAEALAAGEGVEDPWYAHNARLALAEALLAEGDARGASAEALAARDAFLSAGRLESGWRASALAGLAAKRSGDEAAARELLTRAAALFSQLEQGWGAEAAASYAALPHVQLLRQELGGQESARVLR